MSCRLIPGLSITEDTIGLAPRPPRPVPALNLAGGPVLHKFVRVWSCLVTGRTYPFRVRPIRVSGDLYRIQGHRGPLEGSSRSLLV